MKYSWKGIMMFITITSESIFLLYRVKKSKQCALVFRVQSIYYICTTIAYITNFRYILFSQIEPILSWLEQRILQRNQYMLNYFCIHLLKNINFIISIITEIDGNIVAWWCILLLHKMHDCRTIWIFI